MTKESPGLVIQILCLYYSAKVNMFQKTLQENLGEQIIFFNGNNYIAQLQHFAEISEIYMMANLYSAATFCIILCLTFSSIWNDRDKHKEWFLCDKHVQCCRLEHIKHQTLFTEWFLYDIYVQCCPQEHL